jgi:hypothetical protein
MGLWEGANYLLKMMTDVWILPLPTMTDPFFLSWFEMSHDDPQSRDQARTCSTSLMAAPFPAPCFAGDPQSRDQAEKAPFPYEGSLP